MRRMKRMKHVKRVSEYLEESEMIRRRKLESRMGRVSVRQKPESRAKRLCGGCWGCGQSGDAPCGDGRTDRDSLSCDGRRGATVPRHGEQPYGYLHGERCGGFNGKQAPGNGGQRGMKCEEGKLCGTEMCKQAAVQKDLKRDIEKDLEAFAAHLRYEGRKESTVKKYLRDLKAFQMWLGDEAMTREKAREWRDFLCEKGYAPVTVNSMLASLNLFFRFCGREECCVKALRLQHRFFRNSERELAQGEYERLVETARWQGKERLALLIETMCATGVRVSEVRAFTVESVRRGRADISLKGKIRTILIPGRLRKKLMRYIRKKKIASGEVFVTRSGKGLTRQQIWAEMKRLCSRAGVLRTKVFPHNLRHLFARTFYRVSRDIAKLADVLGHSHIGTTRLYLTSTGAEHARHLERLNLVSRK